jgi:AcrR family transcriptional regulator
MHKLGAALGVKAMSLYKYVAGKDDLLDGIVVLL